MSLASRSAADDMAVRAFRRATSASASLGSPVASPMMARSAGTMSLGRTVIPRPARRAACCPARDGLILTVLAASATYIAVPAAMKTALPEADLGLSIPMALGITFPFNLLVGIPLYHAVPKLIF